MSTPARSTDTVFESSESDTATPDTRRLAQRDTDSALPMSAHTQSHTIALPQFSLRIQDLLDKGRIFEDWDCFVASNMQNVIFADIFL